MSQLLREEDIRQYFLQNNGVVRNTDIVNYFRSYLSNPAIREESRVLFKAYVNKLAAVKVENGEKFLVLKRQYFHPIDGNGNARQPQGFMQPAAPVPQGGYGTSMGPAAGHDIGLPYPNGLPNVGAPPPSQLQNNQQYYQQHNQQLGSSGAMMNPQFSGQLPRQTSYDAESAQRGVQMHPSLQRSLSQVSQNYLGSQNMNQMFRQDSSSSARNYSDMYGSGSVHPMQRPGFPMGSDNQLYNPGQLGPSSSYSQQSLSKDFPIGLPPPSLTRQSSSSSNYSQPGFGMMSGSGSASRLPPPYRPPPYRAPPLAARFPAYPPEAAAGLRYHAGPQIQQPRMDFKSINHPPDSQVPGPSLSFTTTAPETKYLQQQQDTSTAQLDSGVPAPPVPPRTKRASFKSLSRPNILRMEETTADSNDNYMNDKESAFEINGNDVSEPTSRRPSDSRSEKSSSGCEQDNEKENLANGDQMNGLSDSFSSGASEGTMTRSQAEQLLSVKERTKKFNRMASESEIVPDTPIIKPQQQQQSTSTRQRREASNGHHKQDTQDYDTASLSSFGYHFGHMQPKEKEWILKASDCDYHSLLKLAQENPMLIKRKDINYTALHWAAKRGNADLVKLLAGSYKADVNAKSNGGYTALHLAAQFSRQEVYDLLVQVYNADTSVRDHSGKKPMQYLVRQDTSVSMDTFNTFKKLKDKRRSAEQRDRDSSFLRIGSLNVRVKKTTEAFGYLLGKSNSTANVERILNKSWGSADNIPEDGTAERNGDKDVMPPPSGTSVLRTMSHKHHTKKKHRRGPPQAEAAPIQEVQSDSDSDCGFGSGWKGT